MLQVRVVYTGLPGLPGVNTLYFDGEGGGEAASAVTKTGDFFELATAAIVEQVTVTVLGTVAIMDEETGDITGYATSLDRIIDGQAPDQPLPTATQFNLRFNTGAVVNSRRVQGRAYIAGFGEGANSLGVVDVATAQAVTGWAEDTLGSSTLPAAQHVVWSRPKPGTPGETHPVTAYGFSPQWAVLRSRRD